MAPLHCAAKFDPFLSLDCPPPPALHPGAIQGKKGIKFCQLATLSAVPITRTIRSGGSSTDRSIVRPGVRTDHDRDALFRSVAQAIGSSFPAEAGAASAHAIEESMPQSIRELIGGDRRPELRRSSAFSVDFHRVARQDYISP